jgi:antitoxin HicB
MRTYLYRALIERGEERDWTVSFPDVPEAITQGETIEDAKREGQEALGLALLSYPMRGMALPARSYGVGSPAQFDTYAIDVDISVEPDVAAKLAVLDAFASSGRTKSEFAVMLGKDEKEIRRILDPMHPTKLATLSAALEALGRRLIIGVADIDEAA